MILGHGDIVLHLKKTRDVDVTSGAGGGVCLCVDNFEWGRGANSGKKAVVNKRELGIVDGIRNISINVNLTTQCIKWSSVFGMKYQAEYLQKVHTYFYT